MSTEHFQSNEADEPAQVTTDTTPVDEPENDVSEEQEPRTFTQEELNAIVSKEKAKERRKLERERHQQPEPTRQPSTEAPDPDKFKTAADYLEAVTDWKADQKIAQREQNKRATEVYSTYAEREDAARDRYSDFDELTRHDDLKISPLMAEAIVESDIGPEVAYHLGKNPKEAERISKLSPIGQAREIGKIEAMLSSKTPEAKKQGSSAPEPIKPLGGRASTPAYKTSDPRSFDPKNPSDWIKKRNAELAAKHKQ